jgi:hypothetical protein
VNQKRTAFLLAILVVVSTLFTLALFEGAYRVYLFARLQNYNPLSYAPNDKPDFTFLQPPGRWVYNADYGFDFYPSYLTGNIVNGAFDHCSRGGMIDELGNLARRESRYGTGDMNGILVGSSYTMGTHTNGLFFHEVLEDALSRKTGKRIAIENYSRDSMGIIQMFDMAASLLKSQNPDFLVIAFNTATLSMPRHWRNVLPYKDGFYNFYFMIEPAGEKATRSNSYVHRFVVYDKVTDEWCAEMMAAKKDGQTERLQNDPVIKALIKRHNEILRERKIPKISVDLLSLRRSYLFNRIVRGNVFWNLDIYVNEVNSLLPLQLYRYDDDPKFNESVSKVISAGIPVFLVHIPSYPELLKGEEWAGSGYGGLPISQELSLAESLENLPGLPVRSLLAKSHAPRADAAEFANKADGADRDWHPNAKGIELFVDGLSDLIIDDLHIERIDK